MEKILTVVIPSYNVEQYLEETLASFVYEEVMELIEILIVNDGSKDSTAKIAKRFEKEYPQTFRLIDKENGGHGSTINRGIKEAAGKYFKVVDGDDWVDTDGFAKLVKRLESENADYVVTNYYQVNNQTKEKVKVEYPYLRESPNCTFEEASKQSDILMHALTIKTSILQNNRISLDEHCFYVDNEYITFPVPYVETVSYYDIEVYMYRLAQSTQSVSMNGLQKHVDNHVRVTMRLVEFAAEYSEKSQNMSKINYLNNRAAALVGIQAVIYASFPAGNMAIKQAFEKFDKAVEEKSTVIYELSANKSRMLRGLRKSGFKHYWFWTTLSKLWQRTVS